MTNWEAAQAVQRSAFRDGSNYRSHDATAIQIRKALWGGSAPSVEASSSLTAKQVHSSSPPAEQVHSSSPGAKQVHIVAPGDTLFSIARAWGTSLQAVEAANPHAGHPPGNFDNIHPGDRIVHP
jgi:LysM repeat protein